MVKTKICLNAIKDVNDFVSIMTFKNPFDSDITSDRYKVDAKSIMGIFSLNLSNPVDLIIYAEENDERLKELLSEIDRFIVK